MFAYSPLFLWQVRQAQAAQQAQQIWQIQQAQQVQQMQMQQAQTVHHNRPKRRRRGKTVASKNNQTIHASRNTIANGDGVISHHDCVGDSSNARSGSQGPPPLVSPTPDLESLRRAALESRGKRSRPSLTKATRDDLPQCIVTNDGTECMWDSSLPSFID